MMSNRTLRRFLVHAALAALSVLLVSACSSPILVGGLPGGAVDLSVQGTIPVAATTSSYSGFSTMAVGDPTAIVPVIGVAGTQIGTLTLTNALIALKSIEFELAETDEHADEQATLETGESSSDFDGPYVVNLLTNVMTPQPNLTNLIAGVYEEIEIELDKIEGDEVGEDGTTPIVDSTDPLFGRSIYLAGTYSNVAGTLVEVPFTMAFDLDAEFSLAGAGGTSVGMVIDADTVNSIIIAFRLNKWFDFSNPETEKGVDFSNLTIDPVNGIVLDETETAADLNAGNVQEVIKKNIEKSADYGEDSDNDGELSSEEDDDPDTEDGEDS